MSLSINETEYVQRTLRQGKRPDGRGFGDIRHQEIDLIHPGNVLSRLGKTQVSAQVSARLTVPPANRQYEGVVALSTDSARPEDNDYALSRFLFHTIVRGRVVDRETLCVVAGKCAWEIRVDVHVLSDDGNVFDCALLACIAALSTFRKPETSVENDEITVHPPSEKVPSPLALNHLPICTSYATFVLKNDDNEFEAVSLADPTGLELTLADGALVAAINSAHEICFLEKHGSPYFDFSQTMTAVQASAERHDEALKMLNGVISKAKAFEAVQEAF